ncbi:CHASE domain-containing protein [Altererythrobacter sp. CAU 1778]
MATSNLQAVRRNRLLIRFPRALPIGIFALVMAITILSAFAIERLEAENRAARQSETAGSVAASMENRATAVAAYLRAGAALFSASEEVTPTDFRRFVDGLQIEPEYRGSDGFGWAQTVPVDRIDAFEARQQGLRSSGYEVQPRPQAGDLFAAPVTFIHPNTLRNRRAWGYNMYSEANRREAMMEAAQSAGPVATAPVVLRQEGAQDAPGFIIYMPVFRRDTDAIPIGYVYSPFNAQKFMEAATEKLSTSNYAMAIYDQKADQLLASIGDFDAANDEYITDEIEIAGRPWQLRFEIPPSAGLSLLTQLTLLFGVMVAALLAYVARLLTQQASEDEGAIAWFEEQNSIRNSLTRELNHRVKNTLANVLSIIALTRRRASSLDEFVDGLNGRIRALSATHDLLTQSDWASTPIRAVIDAELAPYALDSETHHLVIEGPDVGLAPNDALSLGLAIHELSTNAAKYGALSVPGGTITVRWQRLRDNLAEISWEESGGPDVPVSPRRGFGLDLIEKIVAHELGNPVDLVFAEHGVECRLIVPVRQPTEFVPRAAQG